MMREKARIHPCKAVVYKVNRTYLYPWKHQRRAEEQRLKWLTVQVRSIVRECGTGFETVADRRMNGGNDLPLSRDKHVG